LALLEKLEALNGVQRLFTGPLFHEVAISLPSPASDILASLKARRVLGGLNLQEYYPELANSILVCGTETKTPADLDHYVDQLREVLPSVHEKAHSYSY
jgi:glycine dehydrogenase subunit 1